MVLLDLVRLDITSMMWAVHPVENPPGPAKPCAPWVRALQQRQ